MVGNRMTYRWRLTNTGNKSVSLKCNDGTQWIEIYFSSVANSRLFDEYLTTYFDNSTKTNSSALNYSSTGSWSNLSDIFDNNPDTYGFCTAGADNCYLTLSYEVKRQSLKRPDIYYSVFNLTNVSSGKYNVIINTWDGYNQTQTLNLTYNITFVAKIYDEMTGKIIDNVTANLTFISDDPSYLQTLSFTTSSGLVSIEGLAYVDYSIIYEAPGYTKRHFYMTKEELQLNGTLNLFLLGVIYGQFAIISVVDQNDKQIEGAFVKVLKNIPNFDNKQILSILRTNFQGESTLDFNFYTDNYQFIVVYDDRIVKISQETQISKQVISIQVPLSEDVFEGTKYYTNVYATAEIINGTISDKTCTFVYSGSGLRSGCVYVTKQNLLGNNIEVCSLCSSLPTAIINCNFNITQDGLYICEGWVDTNTTHSDVPAAQDSISTNDGRDVYGLLGIFITLMIVIGMALLFKEHPSAAIAMSGVGLIFCTLAGFISIPYGSIVLILLIFGYIMLKGDRI
jgi:hypothetical protein